MTTTTDPAAVRFSTTLRDRTMTDHGDAEGSTLMGDLVAGILDRARMGAMLAQHLLVYRALETAAATLTDDPVVAPFLLPGLERTPALEADVALLLGSEAVDAVVARPGTAAYVARLEAVGSWSGGFVAHHYTRYLGDLSGGQHIRRIVEKAYPDLAIRFYTFDAVESPKALKDRYRQLLDEAPWAPDEQDRIVDEVREAYRLNQAMFADLES
ncbi:MAG TPA: biliverdin-producing heme oxygenase [Iamia sp.]|nr:biliverdin-producing heme oxygenase [Iamia sp.]